MEEDGGVGAGSPVRALETDRCRFAHVGADAREPGLPAPNCADTIDSRRQLYVNALAVRRFQVQTWASFVALFERGGRENH